MIHSTELDHQERDLRLNARGPKMSGKEKAEAKTPAETGVDELRALKERIDAAKQIKPMGRDLHCGECFRRGRDAAIRLIEGG